MNRFDYAFPFRIDPASGQAARTGYDTHVEQMIRQVLLTAPGERADLPEFGCGLKKLIFAPHSDALDATTQIAVQQALNRWLADQISVTKVQVGPAAPGQEEQLQVEIDYVLVETQSAQKIVILVS
ncbi:MAG TPA: GPW/gp25 family protein [Terriglobia bacterium]|nr:GPW/gp25 family protein [Terriglobia bacterium]